MTRDPIPLGTAHHRQPSLLAQFDRHESRAIRVRNGRANVRCVHLTSPMVRVWKPKPIGCTPIAPWYLPAPPALPTGRSCLQSAPGGTDQGAGMASGAEERIRELTQRM